jgi:hypothetical protein
MGICYWRIILWYALITVVFVSERLVAGKSIGGHIARICDFYVT